MFKRLFDCLFSCVGLLLLLPLFLLIAVLIKLDSRGSIFFRQDRVGRSGKLFRIHKFRTMSDVDHPSSQITVGADPRITRLGSWLRRTKIDELPQLFDVLSGHMSFVGPRPEVPFYVDYYPSEIRDLVLSVRPGITCIASIKFRDESEMLGRASDPQKTYIDEILPIKLKYYSEYALTHSFFGDFLIIIRTLVHVIRRIIVRRSY